MNTINRYRVGRKCFADLFAAIDEATKRRCNVIDGTNGLTVWVYRK